MAPHETGTWDSFSEVQYSQEALSGSVFSIVQSDFPSRRAALRIESNSFLPGFCQRCTWRGSDTTPGLAPGYEGVRAALFHSL